MTTTDVPKLLQNRGFNCYYFRDDRSNVVAISNQVHPGDLLRQLEFISESGV